MPPLWLEAGPGGCATRSASRVMGGVVVACWPRLVAPTTLVQPSAAWGRRAVMSTDKQTQFSGSVGTARGRPSIPGNSRDPEGPASFEHRNQVTPNSRRQTSV